MPNFETIRPSTSIYQGLWLVQKPRNELAAELHIVMIKNISNNVSQSVMCAIFKKEAC